MSKFTNAIKAMSKLKKAMTAMWLGVAATLIAMVATLIAFGGNVSSKDRVKGSDQYSITNPEVKFEADGTTQVKVASLAIEQTAFGTETDANYSEQADILTRFLFDVKARSNKYHAKYNTATKVGAFFLIGTKDDTDANAKAGWVAGTAVIKAISNEVKVIATPAAAQKVAAWAKILTETGFAPLPAATTTEVIATDLDETMDQNPTSGQLFYSVERASNTITRVTGAADPADATTDVFTLKFNDKAFAYNSTAKNDSNAVAAVGTIFALTLVGAIGTTVAESIYRKKGAKK